MKTKHYPKLKQIFNILILFSALFLILVSWTCTNKETHNLLGVYQSKEISKINIAYSQYLEKKLYIKNNKLTIIEDSTFEYISCGNYITGKYQIQKDTLKLFCYSNTQKYDSITRTFEYPYDTLFYHIKDENSLIGQTKIYGGKFDGYIQQDYLIKVNDN